MLYLNIVLSLFVIVLINRKLTSVNTNYLCSSVLGNNIYKNYKKSCKLDCELKTNYSFPIYKNESCYKMYLYIIKNGKYFSLFTINISYFSYESNYLNSAVIIVLQ